ncbi:MAG: RNA methyltransferase [Ruminococcaceae bacterium]|nr:RNA methyltransferase [Oscillospiraceae bacterium]
MIITSRQNPLVVRLSKLSDRKHRKSERLFLAEGVKLAAEAAASGVVEYLLVTEEHAASPVAKSVEASGGEVITVSVEVLEKISTESAPQGMIAVCRMMDDVHSVYGNGGSFYGRILILDRVRDPGNLGTILRSAEAFGGVRLFVSGCADIYNPKTVRGSMGAVFRVNTVEFETTEAAVTAAKAMGYRVLGAALDDTAVRLGEYSLCGDDAVIIGTEGKGIADDVLKMCDGKLYIPMAGGESLNCSVAASVIMWEMFKGEL